MMFTANFIMHDEEEYMLLFIFSGIQLLYM